MATNKNILARPGEHGHNGQPNLRLWTATMLSSVDQNLFLFVPANRPERFAKAATSGADAVIIDLEDAVAPPLKDEARDAMGATFREPLAVPSYLRVNGAGTRWHDDDISTAAALPIDGIVLPKAESAEDIERLRARLPQGMPVLAIIESARGLAAVDPIAVASDRLIFGSVDFAVDLGVAHSREALQFARGRIALAARLAQKHAAVDGVTLSISDSTAVEDDARYGAAMGFSGKLLIHPAQVGPARVGLMPPAAEIAWARRVVESAGDGTARALDGIMIDAPVLARAQQIIRSQQRLSNGR